MIRTVRMTHPDVVLPIEVPDDAAVIAVHEEGGWSIDPPPEQTDPALAPIQVDVPEQAKPNKPKAKSKPEPESASDS